jgi:uncharacterized membrane protein YgcG
VVGALWDNHTAGPEVAAILARLIVEKKLSSEVKRVGWWKITTDVLHLKLLVKRSALVGYEQDLIAGLFEHGKTETDTASIRARYRKTGFDPASTIKSGLEAIVGKPNPDDPDAPKPSPAPTIALVLLGLALLIYGIRADALDAPWVAAVLASGVVAWIFAVSQAVYWRHRVFRLGRHSLRFLLPLAVPLGVLAWLLWLNPERAGLPTLAGFTLLALGVANCVLNMAQSRQGAERIARRKQLAAAREYFRHELQQQHPRLLDEWFPWLIAFELGRSMDRWFAAFGPTGQAVSRPSSTSFGSSPASTSASGTPSWSGFGGGGGFAGGGSSGSFSAAVGVMAAGVSKPSSSSSSGGDSSGGGSSGGGGGGGW